MVIDKVLLCRYLDLLLVGKMNTEALMRVEPNEIRALVVNDNKTLALRSSLKGGFEDLGELGIDNLALLKSLISKPEIESQISVEKKENKLAIKAGKTAISYILRNPAYIKSTLDEQKFETLIPKADPFPLSQKTIKTIVSNYTSLIGSEKMVLQGKGDALLFETEHNENRIATEFDVPSAGEFTVTMSGLVIDVLNVLPEKVDFRVAENSPVYIVGEEENILTEFIIAPIKNE